MPQPSRAKHLFGGTLIGLASLPLAVSSVYLFLLMVDGGWAVLAWWLGLLAITGLMIRRGLKYWGEKRRHVTVGTLFTVVGAFASVFTITFIPVVNSRAWRVGGGTGQVARGALAFAIYAIALLGAGVPLLVYQHRNGGLYSWRKAHHIREGAKIKPAKKPVKSQYRPQ